MDFFQFISYIRQFNADVVIIGAAVWGLHLLLRKTLLKKVSRHKLFTFLPFLIGTLLYSVYAVIMSGPLETNWVEALNAGITCGSLATVIEVVYEQFIRDTATTDVRIGCVKALLADYGEISDELAEQIVQTVQIDDEQQVKTLLKDIMNEAMAGTFYPLLYRTLTSLNS